uniref:Uncharacterized protein n=1 Tax=Physcomitrium patens TaxID=3218 RepID=A0A2K1JDQ5_PHYPA|nr:hypothetical protein PHYPA_019934 [Physcomitrium patens]
MASDATSESEKKDETVANAQGEQSRKQPLDPDSYSPPCCAFRENHLPIHLQHLQYGQLDEAFFSHFPPAALNMLAWQWPSNLAFAAAAPCSMSKDMSASSNHENTLNPVFEYVNQLGAVCKQLPMHLDQAPQQQHHYLCQYPHFMQMPQGLEVHDMQNQNTTPCKGEQSNLAELQRSEVTPHLTNISSAVSTHSMPTNFLPGVSTFQPRVGNNLAGYSSCGDAGMRSSYPELLSKTANTQSHQGDVREENCSRKRKQAGSEQTQYKYSSQYAAVSPGQRLFHAPTSSGALIPQDSAHCIEDCLQHHCRVPCGSLMPAMSCLVNIDPIDSADHGAAQRNGLQPGVGLWSQVGASSVYSPRCLQCVPAPASTKVIHTPFLVSSASSTSPDVFNASRDFCSGASLPSSSSPFQLSAQSAFSCMTSYDSPFLRPTSNPKVAGCYMQCMNPEFTTLTPPTANLPGSQRGQSACSDKITRRDERSEHDPKCHSSDSRISIGSPAGIGSRHEPAEGCQGSDPGIVSSSVEHISLVNEFSSKESGDRREERNELGRTPEFIAREPSESAGVVYSSHQGGRCSGGRISSPEFCNLLGQDKHVLMRKNGQYTSPNDPLKMQVGGLAPSEHQTFDLANATALGYVPLGDVHEVHTVPMDKSSSTLRQPGMKGQWGAAEDRVLRKLVKQYGSRRWSLISTFMASEYINHVYFLHTNASVSKTPDNLMGYDMLKSYS